MYSFSGLSPSALPTITYWANVFRTDECNELFMAKISTLLNMMTRTARTAPTIWRSVESRDM